MDVETATGLFQPKRIVRFETFRRATCLFTGPRRLVDALNCVHHELNLRTNNFPDESRFFCFVLAPRTDAYFDRTVTFLEILLHLTPQLLRWFGSSAARIQWNLLITSSIEEFIHGS